MPVIPLQRADVKPLPIYPCLEQARRLPVDPQGLHRKGKTQREKKKKTIKLLTRPCGHSLGGKKVLLRDGGLHTSNEPDA